NTTRGTPTGCPSYSGCVLRGLGRVDVGGQRALRALDERRERRGPVDGPLGEPATGDLHAGQAPALAAADVGEASRAGARGDPLGPQAGEVALALAAVAVRVDERVGDLLLRLAVQARTLTPVARGTLEDDATLLLRVDCALDSSHE